jgi:hypothetical protein
VPRLEEFVSILRQLHSDFALLYGIHDDKLRFVYFDSGSDLLNKIKCTVPIATSIWTLLNEWWANFKFRHQKEFGQDMDAVSKGFTVMGQVQDAVQKDVITEETGNLLKARILKGVDGLIGISAKLPIQQEPEIVDMRQILIEKRDQKLLTSGETTEPDNTFPSPVSD